MGRRLLRDSQLDEDSGLLEPPWENIGAQCSSVRCGGCEKMISRAEQATYRICCEDCWIGMLPAGRSGQEKRTLRFVL